MNGCLLTILSLYCKFLATIVSRTLFGHYMLRKSVKNLLYVEVYQEVWCNVKLVDCNFALILDVWHNCPLKAPKYQHTMYAQEISGVF